MSDPEVLGAILGDQKNRGEVMHCKFRDRVGSMRAAELSLSHGLDARSDQCYWRVRFAEAFNGCRIFISPQSVQSC